MRAWAAGLVALTLAVPVGTAEAHPADYMYTPGGEYVREIGNPDDGVGTFLQREADTPGSFTQIGHEPLMGRGMNAAIAVHKRYVYVGSRTDAKNNNANHAGIFIVDAQDPAHPFITKEMGLPYEGLPGESSRELRVWRSQNVLVVQHTNCGGNGAHQCAQPNRSSFRFYDISGEYGANPRLLPQSLILIRTSQLSHCRALRQTLLGNRFFALLPFALAPSGFPGRFGPICRRHSFPLFPVNPKVETPPCLRWNRGSCLSVARRSRGEILKGCIGGRFCRWRTLELFLHAYFP